jgi:hypothetical protein
VVTAWSFKTTKPLKEISRADLCSRIDPAKPFADQLAAASLDLLREMLCVPRTTSVQVNRYRGVTGWGRA